MRLNTLKLKIPLFRNKIKGLKKSSFRLSNILRRWLLLQSFGILACQTAYLYLPRPGHYITPNVLIGKNNVRPPTFLILKSLRELDPFSVSITTYLNSYHFRFSNLILACMFSCFNVSNNRPQESQVVI